jgi:hypothetical protein
MLDGRMLVFEVAGWYDSLQARVAVRCWTRREKRKPTAAKLIVMWKKVGKKQAVDVVGERQGK